MVSKKSPIDLNVLRDLDPLADPMWAWGAASIWMGMYKPTPGVRVVYENLEALPQRPVIIAMNHTQFYDFLPLRSPLLFRGKQFVSWVKARAYRNPYAANFLMRTGNIPICSKGYILASDFYALFERAPTEEEYRAMRANLDRQEPFPQDEVFDILQHRKRDILARPFDPKKETWREAMRNISYEFMLITLDKTRQCVDRGQHVHVYPQGTIDARLIPGKTGIIQTALALDLPILPVGVSGCTDGFYKNTPWPMPHTTFTVRFGDTPYVVPRDEFPPSYRPFHPDDEAPYKDRLQRHVDVIMNQLNALLDPECQWADDLHPSHAKTGVDRFF